MNLFWLFGGVTVDVAATMTSMALPHQHVFKVHVLELLQVICTAIREYCRRFQVSWPALDDLYKTSHGRHPLTLWTLESVRNLQVLMRYVRAAMIECQLRHISIDKCQVVYNCIVRQRMVPRLEGLAVNKAECLECVLYPRRAVVYPAWCASPPPICVNDPKLANHADDRVAAAYDAAQSAADAGHLHRAYQCYLVAKVGAWMHLSRPAIFPLVQHPFLEPAVHLVPERDEKKPSRPPRRRCVGWRL